MEGAVQSGERAAAALAETLAVLVDRAARLHGGVTVKRLCRRACPS
jgi:hypothetical protein